MSVTMIKLNKIPKMEMKMDGSNMDLRWIAVDWMDMCKHVYGSLNVLWVWQPAAVNCLLDLVWPDTTSSTSFSAGGCSRSHREAWSSLTHTSVKTWEYSPYKCCENSHTVQCLTFSSDLTSPLCVVPATGRWEYTQHQDHSELELYNRLWVSENMYAVIGGI